MTQDTYDGQESQLATMQELQELLREATITDDLEGVRSLLQQWRSNASLTGPTAEDLKYILSSAAKNDHPVIMKYLLDEGAEITPSLVTGMSKGGSPATFQVLLDYGWDINSRGTTGASMLRHILSQTSLVEWFLTHGADPNLSDSRGILPLEAAARNAPLATVKLLMQHSAQPANKSDRALHAAASGTESNRTAVLAYLLEQGADIHALATDLPRASHARKPHTGNTPLHSAARAGNRVTAEFLLQKGAYRDALNEEGYTPAQWARRFKQEEIAEYLSRKE